MALDVDALTGVVDTARRARTDLAARAAEWLAQNDAPEWMRSLFAFECAIASAPSPDDAVERLGDDVVYDDTRVAASGAFKALSFACDPVPLHWHWAETGEVDPAQASAQAGYLLGTYHGEVSVVPAPPPVLELWRRASVSPVAVDDALAALESAPAGASYPDDADGWLDELLAAGAVRLVGVRS